MHNRIPAYPTRPTPDEVLFGLIIMLFIVGFFVHFVVFSKPDLTVECKECYECNALIGGKVFMTDRVYTEDVPGLIEDIADAQESFKFSLNYGHIVYKYDDIKCNCLEGKSADTYELDKLDARSKAALQFKAYIEAKEKRQNNKQHSQNVYNPYQNGKRIAE